MQFFFGWESAEQNKISSTCVRIRGMEIYFNWAKQNNEEQ
jgi:hypothetical protein